MNVAADLQRFCWLVEDGFETSLKQWSDSIVFSIEPHAIADIQPMERFAKVGLSTLQLEMVVVTHQGVTVQPYPEPFGQAAQQFDDFFTATRRAEDRSPLGSAIQKMIPCSWEVHSGCASHENDNAVSRKNTIYICCVRQRNPVSLMGIVFCNLYRHPPRPGLELSRKDAQRNEENRVLFVK
jgi:hypothetical protein